MNQEQKAKKSTYDQEYARRYVARKVLNFNTLNPADARILEHLNRQRNMSDYIKGLITKDMRRP